VTLTHTSNQETKELSAEAGLILSAIELSQSIGIQVLVFPSSKVKTRGVKKKSQYFKLKTKVCIIISTT
jgi:hypothetical protein